MSAAPFNPEDIPKEAREGFVAGIIGAMAMTARLLLSQDKQTWGWAARRVTAASITAVLSNDAAQDYITSSSLRTAAVGAISYASPEALDALLRWIKNRADREVEKVAKPKPHGKASRKKRK